MGALVSLVAVAVLALLAVVAVTSDDLRLVFGVVIPGVAFAIFLLGILARVIRWARAPVPFRIPTTGGQQKSLPWIKNSTFDNPSGMLGVIGRMLLEVLCFRSLFRNTKVEILTDKEKVNYISTKYLWAAAMAFHWSMLIVIFRHFRFFLEPVPQVVEFVQFVDGFFKIGVPVIYATSVVLIASLAYLLLRRLVDAKVKYISLPTDYFALYLLLGIAISGFLMRHLEKVDIVNVKAAIAGWASFKLVVPEGVGAMYFIHVFLVSALLIYFPFPKETTFTIYLVN